MNALTALGLVTEMGRIHRHHYLLQNGANSGVRRVLRSHYDPPKRIGRSHEGRAGCHTSRKEDGSANHQLCARQVRHSRSQPIERLIEHLCRPDFEAVENHLKTLGATHVFPYSRLLDRSFKKEFAELRQVSPSTSAIGADFSATYRPIIQ